MKPHRLSLIITGKALLDGQPVVYQRVPKGTGSLTVPGRHDLQIRAQVIPANPRSAPQQAHRARLAQAVEAWHALSETDRDAWRRLAERKRATGFNLFIRHALKGA